MQPRQPAECHSKDEVSDDHLTEDDSVFNIMDDAKLDPTTILGDFNSLKLNSTCSENFSAEETENIKNIQSILTLATEQLENAENKETLNTVHLAIDLIKTVSNPTESLKQQFSYAYSLASHLTYPTNPLLALEYAETALIHYAHNYSIFIKHIVFLKNDPHIYHAYKIKSFEERMEKFIHNYPLALLRSLSNEALELGIEEGLKIVLFRPSMAPPLVGLIHEVLRRVNHILENPVCRFYKMTEEIIYTNYFLDTAYESKMLMEEIKYNKIYQDLFLSNAELAFERLTHSGKLIYESYHLDLKGSIANFIEADKACQLDPFLLFNFGEDQFKNNNVKEAKKLFLRITNWDNKDSKYNDAFSQANFMLAYIYTQEIEKENTTKKNKNPSDKYNLALSHFLAGINYDTNESHLEDLQLKIKFMLTNLILPKGSAESSYHYEDILQKIKTSPVIAKKLAEESLRKAPLQSTKFYCLSLALFKIAMKKEQPEDTQNALIYIKIAIWLHKKPFNFTNDPRENRLVNTQHAYIDYQFFKLERDIHLASKQYSEALNSHANLIDSYLAQKNAESNQQYKLMVANGFLPKMSLQVDEIEKNKECVDSMYTNQVSMAEKYIRQNEYVLAQNILNFLLHIKHTPEIDLLNDKIQEYKTSSSCSKKIVKHKTPALKIEIQAESEKIIPPNPLDLTSKAEAPNEQDNLAQAEAKKQAKIAKEELKKQAKNQRKAARKLKEAEEERIKNAEITLQQQKVAEEALKQTEEENFQNELIQNRLPIFRLERLLPFVSEDTLEFLKTISSWLNEFSKNKAEGKYIDSPLNLQINGSFVFYFLLKILGIDTGKYRPNDIDLSVTLKNDVYNLDHSLIKEMSSCGFKIKNTCDRYILLEKPLTDLTQEDIENENKFILSMTIKFGSYRKSINPINLTNHFLELHPDGFVSLDAQDLELQQKIFYDLKNKICSISNVLTYIENKCPLDNFIYRFLKIIKDVEPLNFKLDDVSQHMLTNTEWQKSYFISRLKVSGEEKEIALKAQLFNCYRDIATLIEKKYFSLPETKSFIQAFVYALIVLNFNPSDSLNNKMREASFEQAIKITEELLTNEFNLSQNKMSLIKELYTLLIDKIKKGRSGDSWESSN